MMAEEQEQAGVNAEAGDNPGAGAVVGAGGPGVTMTQMMELLLQDRRQREELFAEERRLREQELQRCDEELRTDQQRREEENIRKERDMREHLEILRNLVGEIHDQGEAAQREQEAKDKDMKVAKLADTDDIEAYLTTFERQMVAYDVPRGRVFKLAPQLSGKAQQAYVAKDAAESSNYERVREAILLRYDIDQGSYRQRFRTAKRKEGETNRELTTRLQDLVEKWTKKCETIAEVKDLIVMEQLVKTLPGDIRIFVVERQPKTAVEAAKSVDDYHLARRGQDDDRKRNKKMGIKCLRCMKTRHIARDCRAPPPRHLENGTNKSNGKNHKQGKDLKDIECSNCRQKGHYSSNCPDRSLFCVERRVGHRGDTSIRERKETTRTMLGIMKPGIVEGHPVKDILIDTGCSRTMVHEKNVPPGKVLQGEAIAIRCVHGDTVLYPLTLVTVEVAGRGFTMEAAVSRTLPTAVLLGMDVAELAEILGEDLKESRI